MQACDKCGALKTRRRCERCKRMLCARCSMWAGSSRSIDHGPIVAICYDDDCDDLEREALKGTKRDD